MSSPDIIKNLIPRLFLKRLMLSVAMIVFFVFVLYPFPVLASDLEVGSIEEELNVLSIENSLPDNVDLAVVLTDNYQITAYSSDIAQTDGNPCRTAVGFDLCQNDTEDSVAANFLPFGAKIRMPELFGDRVFIVRDRMNAKYQNRIDVWFKNRADAVKFGVKIGKVEILAEP